jgi:hypothetical protein
MKNKNNTKQNSNYKSFVLVGPQFNITNTQNISNMQMFFNISI